MNGKEAKRYPFNAEKHAHDIELACNRTYNLMYDAQMKGDCDAVEELEARHDKLNDLLHAVLGTMDSRRISWLTGSEIALAKETVAWAENDRAEKHLSARQQSGHERNGASCAPEASPDLPDFCHSIHPSSGNLIILQKGEKGYVSFGVYTPDREKNKMLAAQYNQKYHITPQQEAAMLGGMLHGWDSPAAKLSSYDARGNPIKPPQRGGQER